MSPELIGIITIGVALAALSVTLFAWLRQEMKEQRQEMKEQRREMKEEMKEQRIALEQKITEQGKELHDVMTAQGKELEGVKIEVASLRATVETYFRVRVEPPRTEAPRAAAVAEPPGDYDTD